MEGAYSRAVEEQLSEETNHLGETVYLEDKIAFWRANIPSAAGLPGVVNLMALQRQLQLNWPLHGEAPEVLMGDLLGWRHADLQDWARTHPGASPTGFSRTVP